MPKSVKNPHLSRQPDPPIAAIIGTLSCPSAVLGGHGGPIHSLYVWGGPGAAVAGQEVRRAARTRSKPTTRPLRARTDFGRYDGLHGGLQPGHGAQVDQRLGRHLSTPRGTNDEAPAWAWAPKCRRGSDNLMKTSLFSSKACTPFPPQFRAAQSVQGGDRGFCALPTLVIDIPRPGQAPDSRLDSLFSCSSARK